MPSSAALGSAPWFLQTMPRVRSDACQNGGAGPPSLAAFCVPTLLITDDSPCLLAQRLEVRPGSCKLCHASRAPKLNERTGEAPTASRLPSCGQTPPKVVLGQ